MLATVHPANAAVSDYLVNSFDSQIEINQDTSLSVTETIEVFFNIQKHGIFRIIPVVYSAGGKTIKARLIISSITNAQGQPYKYTTSRLNQSLQIKIGDPNSTLTGRQTYVIKYTIKDVLLSFKDHAEVYWNITGSEWDTIIQKASATVFSPSAEIIKTECYSGAIKTQIKNCTADFSGQQADFLATSPISWGCDLTIVVGLNPKNSLKFPEPIEKTLKLLSDNWGYPVALLPLGLLFFGWYKKGRDKRYLSDNLYIKDTAKPEKTVSIFHHEYLPLVYSPIDNLTPSQVGTIIDEKVDTKDVIAEIVELARLKYLEIKRIETKKLLRKNTDYLFIKKEKDPTPLKDYQKYLLDKIFDSKSEIKLSDLNNTFYPHLETFRQKLYANLKKEGIYLGDPRLARVKWGGIYALLMTLAFIPLISFVVSNANGLPFWLYFFSIMPAILLIKNMPSRTAWGYSLYRQIQGLKFYIDKGKWREEIAEKNLFFEEILPLAICLGLVQRLAKDMESLGIKPPSYLNSFYAGNFYSNFNHFSTKTASSFVSVPTNTKWSGSSHWSGGSGFSSSSGGGFSGGGSSGGGFGGGGGGSW